MGFTEIPAGPEEVRARHRGLAKQLHPDAGGEEEDFEALKKASEEVLKWFEKTFRFSPKSLSHLGRVRFLFMVLLAILSRIGGMTASMRHTKPPSGTSILLGGDGSGIGSPSSSTPQRCSSRASLAIKNASSSVSPSVTMPGKSGNVIQYPPSSHGSNIAG